MVASHVSKGVGCKGNEFSQTINTFVSTHRGGKCQTVVQLWDYRGVIATLVLIYNGIGNNNNNNNNNNNKNNNK